jgi:hypothetical protein
MWESWSTSTPTLFRCVANAYYGFQKISRHSMQSKSRVESALIAVGDRRAVGSHFKERLNEDEWRYF